MESIGFSRIIDHDRILVVTLLSANYLKSIDLMKIRYQE